ncbi:MAG: periplasmic heavy metal sensor [Opitutaceae bacterium]
MRTVIIFFVSVFAVAAISSLTTSYFVREKPVSSRDMHNWLHAQLHISDAQLIALEEIEEHFAAEGDLLRNALAKSKAELAIALREEGTFTPRVAAAVEALHFNMGELQKLSIAHLYEMTTVLDPDQTQQLMQYAEMALTTAP